MNVDEMFEKLGYEKQEIIDEDTNELICIKYTKNIFEDEYQYIVFDTKHNLLNTTREMRNFYRTVTSIISMQELQAINKKVEELGWLE